MNSRIIHRVAHACQRPWLQSLNWVAENAVHCWAQSILIALEVWHMGHRQDCVCRARAHVIVHDRALQKFAVEPIDLFSCPGNTVSMSIKELHQPRWFLQSCNMIKYPIGPTVGQSENWEHAERVHARSSRYSTVCCWQTIYHGDCSMLVEAACLHLLPSLELGYDTSRCCTKVSLNVYFNVRKNVGHVLHDMLHMHTICLARFTTNCWLASRVRASSLEIRLNVSRSGDSRHESRAQSSSTIIVTMMWSW